MKNKTAAELVKEQLNGETSLSSVLGEVIDFEKHSLQDILDGVFLAVRKHARRFENTEGVGTWNLASKRIERISTLGPVRVFDKTTTKALVKSSYPVYKKEV